MYKRKTDRSLILLLVLGLVLVAAGAIILFFPRMTNAVYESGVQSEMEQFEQKYHISPAKESPKAQKAEEPAETVPSIYDELYQELQWRNQLLYEGHQLDLTDPFAYEQIQVDLSKYGISDNTIGFIWIEKMNVTLPIILGATKENMSKGAVHLTETSYPIGGENTNSVIAAHRGSSVHEMFRNIHLLELGDIVEITNFREKLNYRVCGIKIISPTDFQELYIQDGRDMVTLITCNPLGQNYERYVVYCERVTDQK